MSRSYRRPYYQKSRWEKSHNEYGQRQHRRTTKIELSTATDFDELDISPRKIHPEHHRQSPIEIPLLNYCEVNAEEFLTRWGRPLKTGYKCRVNPKIEAPWGGCYCYLYHNSYYRKRSRK